MRHASQLYRGLAEAARSLERPYIPRHVPLPSSSYSAVAQSPATTHPPRPPPLERDSIRAAEVQNCQGSCHLPEEVVRPQLSSEKDRSAAGAQSRHSHDQPAALNRSQLRQGEAVLRTGLNDCPSIPRPKQRISLQTDHHTNGVRGRSRSPLERQSKSASKGTASQTGIPHPKSTRAPVKRNNPRDSEPPSALKAVAAAYPGLSEIQADLLLRIFQQIKARRSHAPSAVVAWYEDFVWTSERESQGAQTIETSESLSLLLRYAYQRNDLRSLLRLESRATRTTMLNKHSRTGESMSTSMPKELADSKMDGISVWPESDEDPSILAYNLKVAFAAREGNWVQVDELLNDGRLAKMSPGNAARSSAFSARSASVLNSIGWGSLLRFGLGNVQKVEVEHTGGNPAADTAEEAHRAAINESGGANESVSSLLEDIEAEKVRKATEDKMQMQAKLAVTKRLLPALLSYTSGSSGDGRTNNATSSSAPRQSSADVVEPKTPAWLLQSVLAQLADRGETGSIIRIVQLALSEESSAVQHSPTASKRQRTHILNLALTACVRNQNINLAETLRIFNSLTGSQLGQSVSGPAVLTQPTVMNAGQRALRSQSQPSAMKDNPKDAEGDSQKSSAGRSKQKWMAPNEESLVLVLKKVRHPLFRAAWARKLVQEFERLFPNVKLSGRTFRMIIDKCVSPAAQLSSSSEPDDASTPPPAAASASADRIVASGRRGRRLRLEASKPSLSTDIAPPHPASPARRPIVKQSILLATLDDIVNRFNPPHSSSSPALRFHLSTTNRRRFEHTLLRAKRTLQVKRAFHQNELRASPAFKIDRNGLETHHTRAITQIDTLLHRIAHVQRLGRYHESHRKQLAHPNV